VIRWDDEGNGEIYTERMVHHVGDVSDDVVNAHPLYVVENGKEYRLVSLQERMQRFEPQKTRSKPRPIQEMVEKDIFAGASPVPPNGAASPDVLERSPTPEEVAVPPAEPIKCQNLPYIVEEQVPLLYNLFLLRRHQH
jgi:hypothetical protein